LILEVFHANADEELDRQRPVNARIDGIRQVIPAGRPITLNHGQSICLEQRVYHRFYGEPGKGPVLVGEVSSVNDDDHDNRFHEPLGRFPTIEEDEPPLHLLVKDYAAYAKTSI
jgi:D-lyxose ketol-isomerase